MLPLNRNPKGRPNPAHLVIADIRSLTNEDLSEIWKALKASIQKWAAIRDSR